MARFLHLLKGDSPSLAATVIEEQRQQPGTEVIVVLLEGGRAPDGLAVKKIGTDLDYPQLLELIFESDHVVTW
jgi:hypothetical protein